MRRWSKVSTFASTDAVFATMRRFALTSPSQNVLAYSSSAAAVISCRGVRNVPSVFKNEAGYYPLPVEETHNIRTLLIPSGAYSAIDPCAGDGSAVIEITRGSGAHLKAIELDADRAAACAEKGIETVHGSAFECRVPAESCSLLYLNPPYDTELGPHNNMRMELVFLEHCFRWVIAEGVLAFVIPVTVLSACARLLASQFERIGVYRLTHPECVRFKQVVLLVTARSRNARGDPAGAEALVRASYHQELIPPLGEQVVERYAVPPLSWHYQLHGLAIGCPRRFVAAFDGDAECAGGACAQTAKTNRPPSAATAQGRSRPARL